MSEDIKALELLFQRPLEPIFVPRDNGKAILSVPDEYRTERFQNSELETDSRFSDKVETKIPVLDLQTKPDLSFTHNVDKKEQFSLFRPAHRAAAGRLIEIFMEPENLQAFMATAAYVKDRVNKLLFHYSFSVAVQHRADTRHVRVPPIAETFPTNFVEPSVFQEARAEATLFPNAGDRMHVNIPKNYTASDREDEQRLAYFREDIGVNMHHWHWHLVYPNEGPIEIVNKDRRGELFYHMHHQILARYNVERFCNNLARTESFNNIREPIREGYFPKILNTFNNRTYPARIANQTLRDVNREGNLIQIADFERWRDRIHNAIDHGYVEDISGKRIPLDDFKGIDILGNLLESSMLSINRKYYGDLHGTGHNLISYAHDPDARHLEDISVMGDTTTSMRDPVFYRFHAFIDDIFNKFKSGMPVYDEQHLSYAGITVEHIETKAMASGARENVLVTFWQKSAVDLAAGLDFGPDGNIYAAFIHLQHLPFEYNFLINNSIGEPVKGTCRVFLCPKTDERGIVLSLEEQRLLAIEMDKFTVELMPGQNRVRRRSEESSVTIPYERSFRRVGDKFQPKDAAELSTFQFCGCGFPQHLLLPKGKPEGMLFSLFVMISNYKDDIVEQINTSQDICGDAHSFCGLKDKLYPDKRNMGFPFDRHLPAGNLAALCSVYANMNQTDINIVFSDKLVNKLS